MKTILIYFYRSCVIIFILSRLIYSQEIEYSNITQIVDSNKVIGYNIEPIYPQPFGTTNYFKFSIADSSLVKIYLIDINGITVSTILNGKLKQGFYMVNIFEDNLIKPTLKSGIYFIKLFVDSSDNIYSLRQIKFEACIKLIHISN